MNENVDQVREGLLSRRRALESVQVLAVRKVLLVWGVQVLVWAPAQVVLRAHR